MQDNNLVGILIWVIGIIISLTVGSAMIDETLSIPMIPSVITITSGWIVIIGAIVGATLTIFNK